MSGSRFPDANVPNSDAEQSRIMHRSLSRLFSNNPEFVHGVREDMFRVGQKFAHVAREYRCDLAAISLDPVGLAVDDCISSRRAEKSLSRRKSRPGAKCFAFRLIAVVALVSFPHGQFAKADDLTPCEIALSTPPLNQAAQYLRHKIEIDHPSFYYQIQANKIIPSLGCEKTELVEYFSKFGKLSYRLNKINGDEVYAYNFVDSESYLPEWWFRNFIRRFFSVYYDENGQYKRFITGIQK